MKGRPCCGWNVGLARRWNITRVWINRAIAGGLLIAEILLKGLLLIVALGRISLPLLRESRRCTKAAACPKLWSGRLQVR